VKILWILDFYDWNALLPEHFQGGNCLSDSAVFSKFLPILLAWYLGYAAT